MIVYEKSGENARMQARRFQRLARVAMIMFPMGWLMMCFGGSGSLPYSTGAIFVGAAFVLTLFLIATGTNAIAAGREERLDEFERSIRLKAQAEAYRWFGMFVTAGCAVGFVAGLFGFTITNADDRFLALFFWIIGYGALLPGWFLARALPGQRKAT